MAKAMTESKWLEASTPQGMLTHLRAASARKLRLFACACCRQLWAMIHDERSRRAIEAAESWADGFLSNAELRLGQIAARAAQDEYTTSPTARFGDATSEALCAASGVALPNKAWVWTVANHMRGACWAANGQTQSAIAEAEKVQVQLLRDVFGNPFRHVSVEPAWLIPNVVALAQAAYEERELPSGHLSLARLAVLADAVEEAGCTSAEILTHLRSPGPHVRGCWAADLILGKQ